MPFDNTEAHNAFIAGGSAAGTANQTPAEPSPAAADTGAALATPAAPTGTAPAPGAGAEPVNTPGANGQPASASQAQAAGQQAADAARAAGASREQQEAARQQTITAMLNGKTHELDPNLLIPMQRGRETVHFPLKEVIRFSMNHRDYTAGKQRNETRAQELARLEREYQIRERQFQTRQQQMEEEAERFRRAMEGDDPDEQARVLRHRELMRTDPEYKRMYEDSLAKRELDAQRELESELGLYEETQQLAAEVGDFIAQYGARHFPEVDPEAIRIAYGEALQSGAMRWPAPELSAAERDEVLRTLVPQQVRQLFEQEMGRVSSVRQPLEAQIKDLQQQLAALSAAQGASRHNARTNAAVSRSRAAAGVPVASGSPPAPGRKKAPEPFTSGQLEDKKRDWINQR